MSDISRVQQLINETVRAKGQRIQFVSRLQGPALGPNYGYLPSHVRCKGETRLCARSMNRAIVPCGSCVQGRVPRRDETGAKVGNASSWPVHDGCGGLGIRYNRRYGRCGKGGRR